jgi:hypothetical protein
VSGAVTSQVAANAGEEKPITDKEKVTSVDEAKARKALFGVMNQ